MQSSKMKKRGYAVLWMVVELVIGASLFLFFLSSGVAWGRGEAINKAIIAKDISLMISTLQSATGETHIVYNKDISSYVIRVSGSCVEVYLGASDYTPAKYCSLPSPDIREVSLNKPNILYISKTAEGIILSSTPPENLGLDFCPRASNMAFPLNPIIFIDPSFEGLDEHASETISRITTSLHRALSQRFEKTSTSLADNGLGQAEKLSSGMIEANEKKSDLVIRLKLTSRNEKSILLGFDPNQQKQPFDKMAFIVCTAIKALSGIDVSDRGELSKFFVDADVFANPGTIMVDISSDIFLSGPPQKARLLAHDIGDKLGGAIIDVYSKDE